TWRVVAERLLSEASNGRASAAPRRGRRPSAVVLPNLVSIGASRCGTTSLHRYLDLHPDIAMSKTKELNFFVEERNWQRGVAWYEREFSDSAPVRGEASPHYTAFPRYRGVAGRMARVVPEARLVYLVRDPIDRAISAYSLTRAMG